MLLQSKQLNGASVISMHTGQATCQLGEAIIDPNQLKLEAYYTLSPAKRPEPLVLLAQDIRQASGKRVLIDSTDELTPSSQLIRHQEVMKLKFSLVDKPVRTASGKKLGKVDDYVINTTNWEVQKIYVKPSLIKSLATNNLIIDRSQIVEVSDKEITVDDALAGKPAMVTPPAV